MAHRGRKKPTVSLTQPGPPDAFAAFGLSAADFEVTCGDGKAAISGQRVMWMTVRHLRSGRVVSGKTGTTKRGGEREYQELLRTLLAPFRRY